jgi:hypothetical protein
MQRFNGLDPVIAAYIKTSASICDVLFKVDVDRAVEADRDRGIGTQEHEGNEGGNLHGRTKTGNCTSH